MINIYDTFEGNDNSSLLYFGIAVNYMTQCHQQHIEKCPVTWYR